MTQKRNGNRKRWGTLALALLLVISMAPQAMLTAEAATPKLSATKATLTVGKKKNLTVKNLPSKVKKVTWKSSKPAVARVTKRSNKKAVVTAKKAGTAKLTCTISTANVIYQRTCKVTVKAKSSGSGDSSNSGNSGGTTPSTTEILAIMKSGGNTYLAGTASDSATVYTISEDGTYTISPGSSATAVGARINVTASGTVQLNLNGVTIDNSSLTGKNPVIQFGDNVTAANINIAGTNKITGENAKSTIIKTGNKTPLTMTGSGNLTLIDAMKTTEDGAIGIYGGTGVDISGGGTYTITTNRACVKAGDEDDKATGNIIVNGSALNLTSYQKKGLASDLGNITITGDAIVNSKMTYGDAINAGGSVVINSGKVTIDECYGDGIQGENVNISGGTIDIKTYYEYAGINFYKTNSISGTTVNTYTEQNNSTKVEVINYDTGSHKGIKAGTKKSSWSYTSTDLGSSGQTGASGGLTITGGTLTIDTTNTGIKFNDSNDNKVMIGAPEDAIKSNNTATISGGNLSIAAADDGISVANDLTISGGAYINVTTAYEGIEAATIKVGTANAYTGPTVNVATLDDGINASSKTVSYVYADAKKTKYTKTSTAQSGNAMYVYSGNVNVRIMSSSRTVSLPYTTDTAVSALPLSNKTTASYTASADGDGIDCNGSFYGEGGTVIVYGATGNTANSPIDTDNTFEIGSGVTMLLVGVNTMGEYPTVVNQPYITATSVSGLQSGVSMLITQNSGSANFTATMPTFYAAPTYFLFSSPNLTSGSSYTVTCGSNNTTTLTATTDVQTSGGAPGNGGTPPSNANGTNGSNGTPPDNANGTNGTNTTPPAAPTN